MTDICNKLIVIQLNSLWQAIGYTSVKKALIAMNSTSTNGEYAAKALNIEYKQIGPDEWDFEKPILIEAVDFDNWINLPVRSFDLVIHTPKLTIRVPTVLIAVGFKKMPMKFLRPTKENIYRRDEGKCQYTNKKLSKNESSLDHIIPKSRKGKDTFENLVLCSKEVNLKKGNRTPKEAGLKLLKQPRAPLPTPASSLIKEIKSRDWVHFLSK